MYDGGSEQNRTEISDNCTRRICAFFELSHLEREKKRENTRFLTRKDTFFTFFCKEKLKFAKKSDFGQKSFRKDFFDSTL